MLLVDYRTDSAPYLIDDVEYVPDFRCPCPGIAFEPAPLHRVASGTNRNHTYLLDDPNQNRTIVPAFFTPCCKIRMLLTVIASLPPRRRSEAISMYEISKLLVSAKNKERSADYGKDCSFIT